jgi:NAD(P)-dependent dehydrogenase (short-subunit alcohol dehydrogenase family)
VRYLTVASWPLDDATGMRHEHQGRTLPADNKTLGGRVAIVTGASQGIGEGIARALAAEGAELVLVGRTLASHDAVAASIREQTGTGVVVVQGDAADPKTATRAVEQTIERFGRLDVLVNNAMSFTPRTSLEDTPVEAFRTNLESGFFGTLYFMQAAFPHLGVRGGSIINFGSYNGVAAPAGYAAYGSAKEAIRTLSRVAAREWGKVKIRVNVINPAARSPAAELYFAREPENYQAILDEIALGYLGDPEIDIGRVAVFLAGDDARYVTGQTINVDGGRWMI